jgi:hypothetical protein
MKTQHRPNLMQIHSDKKRSTEQDQIHACHCMSLPTASQNTQYYLQAGYGLACAVARAEMAYFVGALSLGASSFLVRSVGGVVSAVRSFRRRVFCGSVRRGRCLCGSILSEACLLRFSLLGALSLWFDPFGGVSFAVQSVGGVVFAVASFRRRVFCGSVRWGVVFAVPSFGG